MQNAKCKNNAATSYRNQVKDKSIQNLRKLLKADSCIDFLEKKFATEEQTSKKIDSEFLDTSERLDAWF